MTTNTPPVQPDNNPYLNELLPPLDKFSTENPSPELDYVGNLPDFSKEGDLIGFIVQTILRASFYLALIAIIAAGIYYLISQGNEDETRKAKNIMLYLAIGFTIIASAYGIITGIIQFNPF